MRLRVNANALDWSTCNGNQAVSAVIRRQVHSDSSPFGYEFSHLNDFQAQRVSADENRFM